MLRGLGLQFLRGRNPRHQRQVNKDRILAPQFLPHLPNRFKKRQRLNVAHRAADLDNGHVCAIGRNLAHRVLDLVGHVRNHLYRLSQVIAAPLFQNDLLVDAPCCEVVIPRQRSMSEALIVPQVQIRLRPVIRYKHFTMLKRRHRSRVDIQIRVELHHVDAKAAALEQAADRRCRKTLA